MRSVLKLTMAAALGAAVLSFGAPERAIAGEYPDKTVRAIVPFGAGGGTDRWVRVISSVGFDVFDKGMRIQNRGGAGGTVGWKHLLDRGADGHSLLFASPTPVLAALLEKTPPFDPANVKIVAYYSVMKPTLIVLKDKPYASWDGLVKHLKSGGKKLTIGGSITMALGPANVLNQLGLIDRVILVTLFGHRQGGQRLPRRPRRHGRGHHVDRAQPVGPRELDPECVRHRLSEEGQEATRRGAERQDASA